MEPDFEAMTTAALLRYDFGLLAKEALCWLAIVTLDPLIALWALFDERGAMNARYAMSLWHQNQGALHVRLAEEWKRRADVRDKE